MAAAEALSRPTRDQRREAILTIAHDVFLEAGFEGASMSQVAARLGGSKGTLYSYFDSKEALFEALVAESCAKNGAAVFDVTGSDPMATRLATIARAYLTLVGSDWATRMLQVVAAEARRRPEVGRMFFDAGPGEAITRLARHIDEFVASGQLHVDNSREAAETFLTLCRGTLHLRRMLGQEQAPSTDRIAREADRAVGQFLKIYGV